MRRNRNLQVHLPFRP